MLRAVQNKRAEAEVAQPLYMAERKTCWTLRTHDLGQLQDAISLRIVIQELIVYPAMDKKMGSEGSAITEKDRDPHKRIKEVSLYDWTRQNRFQRACWARRTCTPSSAFPSTRLSIQRSLLPSSRYVFPIAHPKAQSDRALLKSLWTHVFPEESEDIPHFEEYLTYQELLDSARQFRRTQHFAPTRAVDISSEMI